MNQYMYFVFTNEKEFGFAVSEDVENYEVGVVKKINTSFGGTI